MAFWKVKSCKDIDIDKAGLEQLQGFRWSPFKSPIYWKPDANGSMEERIIASEERSDPNSFRVESRAQFLEGIDTYFDHEAVEKVFEPWNGKKLTEQSEGKHGTEYQMHLDPALVNDMFSAMVCHAEDSTEEDEFGIKYKHLVVDWYSVYKPQDFADGRLKYAVVLDDIKRIALAFRPSVITTDQFNSAYITETLSSFVHDKHIRCKVYEETATGAKNTKMYECLKFSINTGLVHSYYDKLNAKETWRCLLQAMLEQVQFKNGKVEKPRSAEFGHLDLVDCLAVLCMRLLGDQSQYKRDLLTQTSFIDNQSIVQSRIQSANLERFMKSSPMAKSFRSW